MIELMLEVVTGALVLTIIIIGVLALIAGGSENAD